LKNEKEFSDFLTSKQPQVLIYCNDLANQDISKTTSEEGESQIKTLDIVSRTCKSQSCWIILLSSSYVFDGKLEKFSANAEMNPPNEFGKIKKSQEQLVWKNNPDAGLLRISNFIFGKEDVESDHSIKYLTKLVEDGKEVELDNWERIHPVSAEDVSVICEVLSGRKIQHCGLYGTWHWGCHNSTTKYELAVEIAKKHNKSHQHIKPSNTPLPNIPQSICLNTIAIQVMEILTTSRKFENFL